MKKIKIFAMQKDEDDILSEWILYHSYLVGIDNIYIIDNNSGENSKKILSHYEKQGLHVYTRNDYSKKGTYLYELIKGVENDCDLAIPIDLDEFISVLDIQNVSNEILIKFARQCMMFDNTYYCNQYADVRKLLKKDEAFHHFVKYGYTSQRQPCSNINIRIIEDNECLSYIKKNSHLILKYHPEWVISCNKEQILKQFNELPLFGRYAFSYYLTSRNMEMDYQNPIEDVLYFDTVDMTDHHDPGGNCNKKFFVPKTLQGVDHGNHYGRVSELTKFQCKPTNLVLFHFHHRGVRKLIQKCKNDILGLGQVKNINDQRELKEKIKQCVPGAHNIETYLNYLIKGPYSLCMTEDSGLYINVLSDKIKTIKKNTNLIIFNDVPVI